MEQGPRQQQHAPEGEGDGHERGPDPHQRRGSAALADGTDEHVRLVKFAKLAKFLRLMRLIKLLKFDNHTVVGMYNDVIEILVKKQI